MFFNYNALDKSIVNALVDDIGSCLTTDSISPKERQLLLMNKAAISDHPAEFMAAFLMVEDLALIAMMRSNPTDSEVASVVNSGVAATFSILEVCTSRLSLTTQAESKN